MPNQIAIIIDWYGPFSLQDAIKDVSQNSWKGIYLAIGKTKYMRGRSPIQYVGIGNLRSRLKEDHHKLKLIVRDRKIWLGDIVSLRIPGPKKKKTDILFDLAEWLLVYFLEPPLNDRKRRRPPHREVTLINRWWKSDDSPRKRRPHPDWPILIDYPGIDYPVRVCWSWDRNFV